MKRCFGTGASPSDRIRIGVGVFTLLQRGSRRILLPHPTGRCIDNLQPEHPSLSLYIYIYIYIYWSGCGASKTLFKYSFLWSKIPLSKMGVYRVRQLHLMLRRQFCRSRERGVISSLTLLPGPLLQSVITYLTTRTEPLQSDCLMSTPRILVRRVLPPLQ